MHLLIRSILLFISAGVLVLWLAAPAIASDGLLEINQTCAIQTGCFDGDSAGYPITIDGSAGRSYRLTGDLVVPDEDTDAIVVDASDIGIDLNNFSIIRSGCEGATTDCTPASGSGSGVERASFASRGISVKNGSITGMGFMGVLLGHQAEVTGLRVRWNRDDGISVGQGSTVAGNTAYQNGDKGVFVGAGSTASENTTYENGDDGISAGVGSTVSGNTAYQNGGDGVFAHLGSTVRRNTVRSNGGYGLNLHVDTAYRENVITSNTTGTVLSGLNMLGNSCNGATTCP